MSYRLNELNPNLLSYLKQNHKMIHYFGLGFIQIKIDDYIRYHFYTDKYPVLTESPHNHRYSFTSTILQGKLTHNIFSFIPNPGGAFYMKNESCNGLTCKSDKILGNLLPMFRTEHKEYSEYWLDKDILHTVLSGHGTVTRVNREIPIKEFAQVIEGGMYKDECPFSLKINEEELWQEVENIINNGE